jgi:CheY-like chemotaxis protein
MRLDDSIDQQALPRRVLFVDDEPLVIRGLRRTLTGRGLPWELHFAETGAAALATLGQEAFAVVVSDLSMPGMDGRALLAQVAERHPGVARVVLSGIADPAEVARTVPSAHLSLTKPFDPAGLSAAIGRAADLHELLVRPSLRAAFAPYPPKPPPVYAAVTATLAREQSSVWDVMDILEAHPALSSHLGRLASLSPLETARPRARLVSYVAGIEPCALRGLVLLVELAESVATKPGAEGPFSVDTFERRALRAAYLAARIVGPRSATERAFVAGLFHDIGELVLAANAPQPLTTRLREMEREGASLEDERSLLGFSRAEAGAFALGHFGFPLETIEAVLGRHDPVESESTGLDVGRAAYVAGVLSRDSDAPVGPGITRGLDLARLGRAHDPRRLEQWRRAARQLTDRATA